MTSKATFLTSSIIDNRKWGSVGRFLSDKIKPDAKLSFVSAYFTVFAYHQLKNELTNINSLRFLFGEPAFIKSLGGSPNKGKSFRRIDLHKIQFKKFKIVNK